MMYNRNLILLVIYTILLLHNDSHAQSVGVGLLNPAGKFHIKGTANVSQLIIEAYSTQSNTKPLIKLRSGSGNDLMWIHADTSVNLFLGVNAGRVNVHSNTVYGLYNTFIGRDAGYSNSSGSNNTSIGWQSLYFNLTGSQNTAHGNRALYSNTSGYVNTAIGNLALYANTTGLYNTAVGGGALSSNTTVSYNTAVGYASLSGNTIGIDNTAIGAFSLSSNVSASENIAIGKSALETQSYNPGFNWISGNMAIGHYALYSNQPTSEYTGKNNTAIGTRALFSNTIGDKNIAMGNSALYSNTLGFANSAIGFNALYSNTKGYSNTANGNEALYSNTTASRNTAIGRNTLHEQSYDNDGVAWNSQNTAIGHEALYYNNPQLTIYGIDNTAVGVRALYFNTNGTYCTAIGSHALSDNTTGDRNTAIGYEALDNNTTGFDNIAIGYGSGTALNALVWNTVSIGNLGWLNGYQNQVFLGNQSTGWIGGWVDWSIYSDARIKNNIHEDVKGLEFITRLRPVTYHRSISAAREITGDKDTEEYPGKYDVEKIRYTGFLAQEVENAALESGYNFSGLHKPKGEHDLYSLTYAEFVVPLVKAVQELVALNAELRNVTIDQQQQIDEQKSAITNMQLTIEKFQSEVKPKEKK